MLRIILQDGTGEFELPENFAVEMFLNNVMLADAGEQTLPMTLPPTSHNLKLVKWGHRLDSRYKPLYSLNVNISEGVFFQKCRMEIFSISEVEGISCSMYFNNGGFYSEVHKKNVWDFDWGEITYTERLSLSNPQNSELYSMILDKVRRDGYVFPQVVSTNEFKRRILYLNTEAISGPAHQITSVEPVEGLIILNEYDIIHNRNIDFSTTYNTLISLVGELSDPLFVYSAENSDDNSEGVLQRLPYNFGLAPFMYFGVFLETFFTLAGYRFSYNDDFVHFYPWFQHIILLHHNADTLITSKMTAPFEYTAVFKKKQAVPNMQVKDLLKKIETYFAGVFVVDEHAKTVKFLFYENILNSSPDFDLTQYLVSKPVVEPMVKTKLELVDKNSKESDDEETDDEKFEIKKIEFNYLLYAAVQLPAKYLKMTIGNMEVEDFLDVEMEMIKIGEVQTLGNTQPQSSGIEYYTIDNDISDDLFLAYYNINSTKQGYSVTNTGTETEPEYVRSNQFRYMTTEKVFSELASTNLGGAEILYAKYREFIENSNIKITCKMRIPLAVLNKLDLQNPKLFQGQKVLVESIKTILGKTDEFQEVTLRTLRNYADRT